MSKINKTKIDENNILEDFNNLISTFNKTALNISNNDYDPEIIRNIPILDKMINTLTPYIKIIKEDKYKREELEVKRKLLNIGSNSNNIKTRELNQDIKIKNINKVTELLSKTIIDGEATENIK